MALIDSNKLITCLVWSGLVDKATCGELKEVIEQCTVKDLYTNADIVAMFTEVQTEIEETVKKEKPIDKNWANGLHYSERIIQGKINKLKEKESEAEGNVD